MGSARIFETTTDRLKALFKNARFRPMGRLESFQYFRSMYAFTNTSIDFGFIGGCLRFILDDLKSDSGSHSSSGYTKSIINFTYKLDSKDCHIYYKGQELYLQNYRSQYTRLESISNGSSTAITATHNQTIYDMISIIAIILADNYSLIRSGHMKFQGVPNE